MKKRIVELGEGRYVTQRTKIIGASTVIEEFLNAFELKQEENDGENLRSRKSPFKESYESIRFLKSYPPANFENEYDLTEIKDSWDEEGCLVYAKGEEVRVYASTERGLLYGASALLHLTQGGYLRQILAYFAPVCRERGMKVFTPSRENIPFFKKFINLLVFYGFNTIMIEVGGAMEYKSHPEINAGWVSYCKEMAEYSGKTTVIQDQTYPWYKNAIHMENGGGEYLSWEEMRQLVDYCKERQMEVIPEVPSLGHCDYLMMGNPDIAERTEDPYPDTYCPSNPRSYEILFDVMDEILEIFKPKRVNIGHDEYYSIAVCEKCRLKSGAEIFAGDVNKIAAYLKERNVKTVIWGDKLLRNAVVPDAGPFGGAEIKMYSPAFHRDGKFIGIMPATWQAIYRVDKEVEILHWNWGLSGKLEDELLEEGFSVRYGNFDSYLFPDWQKRKKEIHGAMISNWSTLNERILQRNGIFFNVAYAYEMFWNPDYRETDFEKIRANVMESLYDRKNPNRKKYQVCEDTSHPKYVEFFYHTDYHPDFQWFVDGVFPEDSKYKIGEVCFLYGDGSKSSIPVRYGDEIGYKYASWKRERMKDQNMYQVDDHLIETTYATLPVQEGEETYYRHIFKNPYPEKELAQISVHVDPEKQCNITVKEIHKLM